MMSDKLTGWMKYCLPFVLVDQYLKNTDKKYSRFGGDSYFLAHLSNHDDIHNASVVAGFVLAIPYMILHPALIILGAGLNLIVLAMILSFLETYSTRKFIIRINAKKSINWILDPEAHKKRRPYH